MAFDTPDWMRDAVRDWDWHINIPPWTIVIPYISWQLAYEGQWISLHLYLGIWLMWLVDGIFSVINWWADAVDNAISFHGSWIDSLFQIANYWADRVLNAWDWIDNASSRLWDTFNGWYWKAREYVDAVFAIVWQALADSVATIWQDLDGWWLTKLAGLQAWVSDLVSIRIAAFFQPYIDIYNFLVAIKSELVLLFNDPEAWLYAKIDRMIERFW